MTTAYHAKYFSHDLTRRGSAADVQRLSMSLFDPCVDLSPDGDRVPVPWRKVAETDNVALDEWFTLQGYNSREMIYVLIYVNGDNNLENLRREDHTWKVRLIEETSIDSSSMGKMCKDESWTN